MFSKLDANSGFWQVPLTEKSITFITSFGRYCYNKLPFGIRVPQSTFNGECRMHSLLEGFPGVLCIMDDILILAQPDKTQQSTPGSAETSFLSWHYT